MRVITLPFGGAIFFLSTILIREVSAKTDRQILDLFYSHTGGINWKVKWDLSDKISICDRKGIRCDGDDGDGPVSDIDLNNNGLTGAIPPEVWLLPNLRYFSTTDNYLYDPGFTGFKENKDDHQVQIIDLSYNTIENIDGVEKAPYSLRYLMLTGNKLSGPFPDGLTSLGNIRKLYLNNNQFTGTIPDSIGQLTQLLELYLYGNELTGMIPTQIGELEKLQIITLAENKLYSTIPQEVNNLLNIQTFSAHNNLRSSGAIVGPLPSFENAPYLNELLLSGNEMSGDIPTNLMANAQTDVGVTIDLDNNYFEGTVPSELVRFDDLYLGIVGNELTSFSDEFCSKGKWMNGLVTQYGCDAIACPLNKYGDAGRYESSEKICKDCDPNGELNNVGGYACTKKTDNDDQLPQYVNNKSGDDNGTTYYDYGYISEELTALTSFYMSMDPLRWDKDAGWATLYSEGNDDQYYNIYISDEMDYCFEFYGLVCENNRVTEIRLSYNGLSGAIHPSLLKLKKLKVLDLSGNDVWFADVYDNNESNSELEHYGFAGLQYAESLEELHMSGTATKNWKGISNGTKLRNLYLNNLQMEEELSDEIYELTNLENFEAKSAGIGGRLASDMKNLVNLKTLNLYYNDLTGTLPDEFRRLKDLRVLDLSENLFEGPIPDGINELTKLEDLAIHNRLRNEDSGLTGKLPTFEDLTKLTYLSLDSNRLTGSIPSSFFNETGERQGMRIFVGLEDNKISGSIPKSLLQYNDLVINLAGNKIDNIDAEFCNKQGWMDGEVKELGCDAILCPKETYDYLGLANSFLNLTCTQCNNNKFFGAKTCDDTGADDDIEPEPDRQALIDLYYSTSGRHWKNSVGWYQNMPMCGSADSGFAGITCDKDGHVTKIELPKNNLEGTVPTSIFQLPHLKKLDLGHNRVVINLDDIKQAKDSLEELIISDTKVTPLNGNVQESSLITLEARNCSLTDIDGLYSLTSLEYLNLSDNFLQTRISHNIEELKKLEIFSCNNCGLYSLIPSEIGELSSLLILNLENNALSGPLPDELGDLTNLSELMLENNKFSYKMISFENLKKLRDLDVSSNELSGSLPESFLRSLDGGNNIKIDLSNNYLTGSIPETLATNLKSENVFLDLTNNEIESIPFSSNDCEQYSKWMEDLVDEFGCNAILCPPNYYTKLGRAYDDSTGRHDCELCSNGGNTHYGNTACDGESSSSDERTALESLYQRFDGLNWIRQRNWMTSASVCSWYGIKCNDELKVISIKMNNNNLSNKIEEDTEMDYLQVFNLPYLEAFEINGNAVGSILYNIPHVVENIKVLGLSSTGAKIFGQLERFPNLEEFYAGNNLLQGELPRELFDLNKLKTLEISKNQLTGTLNGTEALSELKEFYASNNDFTGNIPTSFGTLTKLMVLDLSENQIFSTIPSELGSLESIRELYLQAQRSPGLIIGKIDALSDLRQLERLGLEKNRLTGVIPSNFLSKSIKKDMAIDINLNFNELHGTIPASLLEFRKLNLYIVGNKFEDLTDSFCNNAKGWIGGAVDEFGCDAIGCRKGTYNTLGRQTKEESCFKCENSAFLGSTICAKSSADERSILMALYRKTQGDNWIRRTDWGKDNVNICMWDNVYCEGNLGPRNEGVTKLDLESNGLDGPIPDIIFSLPYLRELNLKGNRIKFSFDSIADAESLETLNLSETGLESLSGLSAARNLKTLHLTDNKLSLELSTTGIFDLHQLEEVYLNYNNFYGPIPTAIGEMTQLTSFYAYDNMIRGSIPSEIGQLGNLKEFAVSENMVSGQLPDQISLLSNLELFSASRVLKSGPKLDGTLPAFEKSVSLLKLYLDYNNIGGPIPSNFLALSNNAVDATISHNLLTGSIPTGLIHTEILNLELEGNMIDDMDGAFCEQSAWMEGLVEYYGCSAILCFPGFSNVNGRTTRGTPYCDDCPIPNSAKYFGSTSCDVEVDTTDAERGVLKTLYSSCNGALWNNSMKWLTTSHVCEWYGVTCNKEKRVTKLYFADNNLTGSPPKEIFYFRFLKEISYRGNDINFKFDGIDRARELTILDLGSTGLTSLQGISKASSIQFIQLNRNKLSGRFPMELFELRNIKEIELGNNSLTGPLPIDFGRLKYLTKVDLSMNNFSGPVPVFEDNWRLEHIDLSHNSLDGYISENFLESLPTKQTIFVDLSSNSIPGVIFSAIGRFDNLEINVADNRIIEVSPTLCAENTFGCDGIMCHPGSYNAIGRQDSDTNPCKSCNYGDAFFGSTKCPDKVASIGSSDGQRYTPWGVAFVTIFITFSCWIFQ